MGARREEARRPGFAPIVYIVKYKGFDAVRV
jgi:hypothetical protein